MSDYTVIGDSTSTHLYHPELSDDGYLDITIELNDTHKMINYDGTLSDVIVLKKFIATPSPTEIPTIAPSEEPSQVPTEEPSVQPSAHLIDLESTIIDSSQYRLSTTININPTTNSLTSHSATLQVAFTICNIFSVFIIFLCV